MDFVEVLAEGTMKAAAMILADRNIKPTAEQLDQLALTLRREVESGYDEALRDAKAALEANMGKAIVKHTVNVACNLMAARALKSAGVIQ